MPTIADVIPFLALIISGIALFRNSKNDTKHDAAQLMEIAIKLETINENVKEVKSDMKDVKTDVEKTKERVIILERDVKSAHERIDKIQKDPR